MRKDSKASFHAGLNEFKYERGSKSLAVRCQFDLTIHEMRSYKSGIGISDYARFTQYRNMGPLPLNQMAASGKPKAISRISYDQYNDRADMVYYDEEDDEYYE